MCPGYKLYCNHLLMVRTIVNLFVTLGSWQSVFGDATHKLIVANVGQYITYQGETN